MKSRLKKENDSLEGFDDKLNQFKSVKNERNFVQLYRSKKSDCTNSCLTSPFHVNSFILRGVSYGI